MKAADVPGHSFTRSHKNETRANFKVPGFYFKINYPKHLTNAFGFIIFVSGLRISSFFHDLVN